MAHHGHATREEAIQKLWGLIKDIRTAMLTSWDGEELHARPMHSYQQDEAGKLCFFTKRDSGKIDEIRRYDKVNVAFSDIEHNTYVSISGKGRLTTDRAKMERFWNPHVKAWFPKGLEDPELALLEIEPESAQYWDSTSSSMRYLWEVAKANVTGSTPNVGEVEKVRLR